MAHLVSVDSQAFVQTDSFHTVMSDIHRFVSTHLLRAVMPYLAGFVMGISDGLSPERALALGVAYGSTAVTLPGTTIPTPNQVDADRITIRALV